MSDKKPNGVERRKPRRMVPYTAEWQRRANEMARGWAPLIYPCRECGGPVFKGYCCNRCGSTNPEGAR